MGRPQCKTAAYSDYAPTEGDDRVAQFSGHVIHVPELSDYLMPMLLAVPLHLLAYHIAVLRGCDVDQPRNLAKSVTVE